MPWIESHDDVGDHRKTQHLCNSLKIAVPTAVGHLHLLWHYTVRTAWEHGDLTGHNPHHIARACWWEGDPETFITALQGAGFMDKMVVHDWSLYARELIYQRTYNKVKRLKRNSCKKAVRTPFLQQNFSTTKPNQTKPIKVCDTPFETPTVEAVREYCLARKNQVDPQRFVDFYTAKGWMVGKNKMRDWRACVRTWENRKGDSIEHDPKKRFM